MAADDPWICSESRGWVEESLERWQYDLEWTMVSAGMVNMGGDKCQNDRRIAARAKRKVYNMVANQL